MQMKGKIAAARAVRRIDQTEDRCIGINKCVSPLIIGNSLLFYNPNLYNAVASNLNSLWTNNLLQSQNKGW
jgi:hypothetical protein